MANCGQCLIEAVEVIELRSDGSCPRCEGNYSKGDLPTPEAELKEFILYFGGRLKGAIGGSSAYSARRKAATIDGAWLQLYNQYEHISRGRVEEVS